MAARFARAFTELGLTGSRWGQVADTTWAHAGPTVLGGSAGERPLAARVVAFRRGDSTLFHHFVAFTPSLAWRGPPAADPGFGERLFTLCADIGRTAKTSGTASRDPDGEERRTVWQRFP